MTAGEQVERVARALFAWDIQEHEEPRPTWEGSEGLRKVFRSGAAVAIAAMQPEPVTDAECDERDALEDVLAEALKTSAAHRIREVDDNEDTEYIAVDDVLPIVFGALRSWPPPTPQADVLAEVRSWASGTIRPDRPLNPIAGYGAEIAARQVNAILDKHEAKS